jgi:hypothetical protein
VSWVQSSRGGGRFPLDIRLAPYYSGVIQEAHYRSGPDDRREGAMSDFDGLSKHDLQALYRLAKAGEAEMERQGKHDKATATRREADRILQALKKKSK